MKIWLGIIVLGLLSVGAIYTAFQQTDILTPTFAFGIVIGTVAILGSILKIWDVFPKDD